MGKRAPLPRFPWLNWTNGSTSPGSTLAREERPGARTALRLTPVRSACTPRWRRAGVHFLACTDADRDQAWCASAHRGRVHARVWVLTLRDLQTTPRVRAFMDHVEEALPPGLRPSACKTRVKGSGEFGRPAASRRRPPPAPERPHKLSRPPRERPHAQRPCMPTESNRPIRTSTVLAPVLAFI